MKIRKLRARIKPKPVYGWKASWGPEYSRPQLVFVDVVGLDREEQRRIVAHYKYLREKVLV